MTKQKDLIKNTLIIAFGKLATQFLTFLLLPLYTTYLAADEFGMADLVMTYVALLTPIITIALEMGAFRFLIDARNNEVEKRRVISNIMQMISILTLLFVVGFMVISLFIPIVYGSIALFIIIAVIFSNMFLQFARGLGDNLKFSIGAIVAGVTTILANIVLIIYAGMGAEGLLWALLLGNAACSIYLFVALRLYRYIRFSNSDMQLKRDLLAYSAPLVPNGISWWIINAADRTIVTIFLGIASNGIYAVAYKFPLIFTGLFSFFGMSWTESASVHINSPDRDKFFSQTMNASIRLFGSLGAVMIAGIPLVFGWFVGDSFREAYLYIPILIVGAFFNSIVGLYSAIYIAKKLTKQVFYTSVAAAIISIGFTLAFIPFLGLYAAALAMAIAYLSMAVFRHYDMKKYVKITYDARIFVILAALYGVAIGLYYTNTIMTNILNIFVIGAGVIMLNWGIVSLLRQKVFKRRTQAMTKEQKAMENTEDHNETLL